MLSHALPAFVQSEVDAKKVRGFGFEDVRVMADKPTRFGELALTRTCAQHGLSTEIDCGPASHMETVNHGNVSRAHLRAFVDTYGVGEQVQIPEDGELLEF
ncbi:MAG: hypothetical protein Q4B54_11660 [Coriobacteriales bacterium]|nr:hypothetical protein [Coriobacteriales bacterium]